ncbi:FtsX-like permease family protein [Enterococcus saccharolyticus]|uniref:ABC3 transporter permease C-terminal domain-containing protein n=1 Tax=Candidatus Enterococcus willemsii TaxID=1857215 RepID=A0ABQ6YYS0_9ENTE|nr:MULTISPECIES: FtsX-like permease family protein [Enterococcus]KAF1303301.1 hypothetical protein BAU17_08735 [Enterococcus sp. CU12B]MCD5001731.1 FtsX-like permease family protein [Enterococcus saccharolyticus]
MFFAKLSAQTLRKNRQIYLPFLCAMIFMVAINLMIHLLVHSDGMQQLSERRGVSHAFNLGQQVIIFLTFIFAVYANHFVSKQRTRELGLFNILGLGKKELYKLTMWELVISYVISLVLGSISGVVFFKFLSLSLLKLYDVGGAFVFTMNGSSFVMIVLEFLFVFVLLFLFNCRYIYKTNPIELLTSVKKGEREPKARWFLTIIGLLALGIGYYLAFTIETPLIAVMTFVVAVILVVIGTYMLFIGGSVTLLKQLKQNKKLYYRPDFFVSVSSMMYRMKQNAAGLASICILSTMALITVSTTVSLYAGREADIAAEFDYDMQLVTSFAPDRWTQKTYDLAKDRKIEITDTRQVKLSTDFLYRREGNQLTWVNEASSDLVSILNNSKANYYTFITVSEYNQLMNTDYQLSKDQVLLDGMGKRVANQPLTIGEQTFNVKEVVTDFPNILEFLGFNRIIVVMADEEIISNAIEKSLPFYEWENVNLWMYHFDFNFTASKKEQRAVFAEDLTDVLNGIYPTRMSYSYGIKSKDLAKERNHDFDNSFFFIGILLSIIFLFATVLIIYFKQISEGVDDRKRFIIMQKVGMSPKEVKRAINQQVLLIFGLPLVTALLHLTFAFPMMKQLLLLFEVRQTDVFFKVTIAVAFVFIVFYYLVYRLTANVYYQIVERKSL